MQGRHGDDHAQGVTLGKDIISNRVQDDNLGQDWTVTNLWQGTGMVQKGIRGVSDHMSPNVLTERAKTLLRRSHRGCFTRVLDVLF